jgi:hypothetical protein
MGLNFRDVGLQGDNLTLGGLLPGTSAVRSLGGLPSGEEYWRVAETKLGKLGCLGEHKKRMEEDTSSPLFLSFAKGDSCLH